MFYEIYAMSSDSLETNNDGDYVKCYSRAPEPLGHQLRNIRTDFPIFVDGEEKVRNEVYASEDLSERYIAHPEVIDYSEGDGEVVFENLDDAEDIKHLLERSGREKSSEIGTQMGYLMADFHRFGAHGDAELDNFLYQDGEIYSIDHEFYSQDPDVSDLYEDIRLIECDARTLDTETYREFITSFRDAYIEELETAEGSEIDVEETIHENRYPFLNNSDEPLQLVTGLWRTKKGHEELNPSLIFDRSRNLIKHTLDEVIKRKTRTP